MEINAELPGENSSQTLPSFKSIFKHQLESEEDLDFLSN
jgi:hypothetical protein